MSRRATLLKRQLMSLKIPRSRRERQSYPRRTIGESGLVLQLSGELARAHGYLDRRVEPSPPQRCCYRQITRRGLAEAEAIWPQDLTPSFRRTHEQDHPTFRPNNQRSSLPPSFLLRRKALTCWGCPYLVPSPRRAEHGPGGSELFSARASSEKRNRHRRMGAGGAELRI